MRKTLPFALVFALVPHVASPNVPIVNAPDAITLSPGTRFAANPIGGYTVHVEGSLGPVDGAFVEVEFSPEAEALVAWCTAPNGGPSGQVHPILSGFTDANGNVTFEVFGGGCVSGQAFAGSSYIAQVRTDGVVAEEPYINSPDAVDSQGRLPTDGPPVGGQRRCDPDGGDPGLESEARVNLSDAVFHTGPIKRGLQAPCSKFTPPYNGNVGVSDAVFLTPYVKAGSLCNCQ